MKTSISSAYEGYDAMETTGGHLSPSDLPLPDMDNMYKILPGTPVTDNVSMQTSPLHADDSAFPTWWMLRSVTTKGSHLYSHSHKGEHPIGEEAYKILYPLGGRPTPSGCTGIGQSEEWDPSNITLYGYTNVHKRSG